MRMCAQVFLKEKTQQELDNKRAICLTDQIIIMQKMVCMPLLRLSYMVTIFHRYAAF